jgi:nucleoid-associated protein YgaU
MASLDELKSKYNSVLEKGKDLGLRIENLHQEGDKLLLRGVVPTDYAKNELWDAIKAVDPNVTDLVADVKVSSGEVYTVRSGDTLSKIAKRFYGDAGSYTKIFEANRDTLSDPDKIEVGQSIKLP